MSSITFNRFLQWEVHIRFVVSKYVLPIEVDAILWFKCVLINFWSEKCSVRNKYLLVSIGRENSSLEDIDIYK